MRRVVITGIGMISPIGNDKKNVIENLKIGKNGIRVIKNMDVSDLKVKIAGECDFDSSEYFDRKSLKRMDRVNQLAIAFPKNNAARDMMSGAPSEAMDGQLKELGLGLLPPPEVKK